MEDLLKYIDTEIKELETIEKSDGFVIVYLNDGVDTIYSVAKGIINRISRDAQDIGPYTPISRIRVFTTYSEARDYVSRVRSITDGSDRQFGYAIWAFDEYRRRLLLKCIQDKVTFERLAKRAKELQDALDRSVVS